MLEWSPESLLCCAGVDVYKLGDSNPRGDESYGRAGVEGKPAVWYGMVWYCMVWYGMVSALQLIDLSESNERYRHATSHLYHNINNAVLTEVVL